MKALLLPALLIALAGCATTPAPEPTPTLRAPECFDGTVEKGCPSWAMDTPSDKTVSHHSVEGNVVSIHYTDGTSAQVWITK